MLSKYTSLENLIRGIYEFIINILQKKKTLSNNAEFLTVAKSLKFSQGTSKNLLYTNFEVHWNEKIILKRHLCPTKLTQQ